jgi:hypothetical protein
VNLHSSQFYIRLPSTINNKIEVLNIFWNIYAPNQTSRSQKGDMK